MTITRIRGRRLQRIRARNLSAQPLCVYCLESGRIRAATQIDHRIPLFLGGVDDDSNRQPLCDDCHEAKSIVERGHRLRLGCDRLGLPLSPDHPWHARSPVDCVPVQPDEPKG